MKKKASEQGAPVRYRYFVSYFWRTGLAWGFQRGTVDFIKMIESMDDIQKLEIALLQNHNIGETEVCVTNFQFMAAMQDVN